MINIKLNGKEIETEAGKTILQVAEENGIQIPTLCHDEELKQFGSCWVCAVKVEGRRGFVTACGTDVLDGMEITTDSEEIKKARKMALELLLSDHYADCDCSEKIDDHTLPAETLFINNSDYLKEKSIWNIWMLSSFICDFSTGSGVLPTSNFSNMRGLREFGIKAGKPEISDFVIVYGEHLNEIQRKTIKQSKFIISIRTHLEDNEISDIVIPQTSYLEIEGTAIANDGRITTYKNPKKSHLFENLLITFKEIGLLNGKKVKKEFWKKQVIQALKTETENKKKITEKEKLTDYLNSIEKIKVDSQKHHSLQNYLIAKLKLTTKE